MINILSEPLVKFMLFCLVCLFRIVEESGSLFEKIVIVNLSRIVFIQNRIAVVLLIRSHYCNTKNHRNGNNHVWTHLEQYTTMVSSK